MARKKDEGIILKLDYEKAYDRVNWDFLEEMLTSRGFGPKWISWIRSVVRDSSLCIRINDMDGSFFKTGKGLRQGDPLSPLLFNLVADVFTRMLIKAASQDLISGLLTDIFPGGIISLQYADDTLLFLQKDLCKAKHFKWLLACFEQLSGMKINFDKSNLMVVGLEEEDSNRFARLFCCKVGSFPFTYLGIPLHYNKLKREDIQPVVDKIIKRIAGWKGKLLSYGGRLILLKSCLASIPTYLMSVIKFPKWAIESINSQMAHFFWNNLEDGRGKYHLANWHLMAQKKDYGGLGIPDLQQMNLCLLASWISRYHLNDNPMWKKIVDYKYKLDNPNLFCGSDLGASPFWKGVLWAKQAAQVGFRWSVGDGRRIRFWEDHWFGNSSLAIQFWPLYVLINEQGKTIAEAWDGETLKFSFRRTVSPLLMEMWNDILSIAEDISFSNEPDSVVWKFTSNGVYSVQSLYAVVSFRGVKPVYPPAIWDLCIPPRVQVFFVAAKQQ